MSDTVRNIAAVLRGNLVLGWNRIKGSCKYHKVVRVFGGARINISKGGKLRLGKGVAIGERTQCTVRGRRADNGTECLS